MAAELEALVTSALDLLAQPDGPNAADGDEQGAVAFAADPLASAGAALGGTAYGPEREATGPAGRVSPPGPAAVPDTGRPPAGAQRRARGPGGPAHPRRPAATPPGGGARPPRPRRR